MAVEAQERVAQFERVELPYAKDALEPHISAQTMNLHYDKHHAAYVNTLNDMVAGTDLAGMSLEEVVRRTGRDESQQKIFNQAGQAWNHNFFWRCMSPEGGGRPAGRLAEMIDRDFGGFDRFQEAFKNAAVSRFGSGWAWLVQADGKLAVSSTLNQDNPLMDGSGTPILGLDVWEHAYYLNYQNRRPDYIAAWWNTVNWDEVERRYKAAKG